MAHRTLKPAAKRYYIEDAKVVIDLAEYEQLINHLGTYSQQEGQPDSVKTKLRQRNALLLKAHRQRLESAKSHYQIKN